MNAAVPLPVGLGLFPLPVAARLAQIDTRNARRWAEGYDYPYKGETRHSTGVMPLELPLIQGERDLTFAEMLTLRLVAAFRTAGLSMRTIRRVSAVAAQHYNTPLPFVSRRFRIDGRKVFVEISKDPVSNDEPVMPKGERRLIDVLSGQENFAEVVEPSLFQNVDWHADLATRWWPIKHSGFVLLDPTVMFGAPHIAGSRVPTDALASAVRAEGNSDQAIAAVADWFGVERAAVRSAAYFEGEWLNRAA